MEWFDRGYKQGLAIKAEDGLFQQWDLLRHPAANQSEASQAGLPHSDIITYKSGQYMFMGHLIIV